MKIIHCADIFLDSRMMTSLSREQVNIRKMEMLRTFTKMADYAAENDVSLILIAGNLFDTRSISASVRNQVLDTIVAHPQIDFIYLQGNGTHDNFLSRVEEIPSNLKLFGSEWLSYTRGKVTVTGIECDEGAEPAWKGIGRISLARDCFNILMLQGKASEIGWQSMKNRGIDYAAAGGEKNYLFSQLDIRGYYGYPGCLDGRDFDECEEHGFIEINVDDNTLRPSFSFIPFASRNLYIVPVDISDVITTQEAGSRIDKALGAGGYATSSLIRIILKGRLDVNSTVSKKHLTEQYRQVFFYAEIVDETELVVSYSDFEKDASLRGEFIRTVLRSELDEKKKLQIIRCGVDLLAGEEL